MPHSSGGTPRCPWPAAAAPPCPTDTGQMRDVLQSLGELVKNFFVKFWILVCAAKFIVVTFTGRLVVFKIVYMLLFLLCLILFQVEMLGAPGGLRRPQGGPADVPVPAGVLQPVAQGAQGLLVAGGGLHHAGAHHELHIPV